MYVQFASLADPVQDLGHEASQPTTTPLFLDPIRIGARDDSHIEGKAVEHVSNALCAAHDLNWG